MQAAIDAAAICNDSVTKMVGAGSETQFAFRGTLQEEKPLRDWLQEVLMNCLGYYTFSFGKLRIGIRENSSVVEAFTEGNILFRSLQLAPAKPSFNHLTANFADQDFAFVNNSVAVYDIDHALHVGGGAGPMSQITRRQARERIAERAARKTKFLEKCRELFVIINQLARGDARGGLNAEFMENLVGAFDFPADIRQAAVFLVLGNVVRINGHDDAAQAVAGQVAHVLLRPKRAVGANHWMNPALSCVARHRAKVFMNERLAADKKQIADVVFHRDVNDVARFLQRDASTLLRIEPVHGKSAEVAFGVADVRDGKLQITRPAVVEHFADELERAFPGTHDWPGRIFDRFARLGGGRIFS